MYNSLLMFWRRVTILFDKRIANFVPFMAYIHHNRTTPVEKREQIIALWSSGVKQAQIAEVVGKRHKLYRTLRLTFCSAERIFPVNLVGRNEQFLAVMS